MTGTGERKEERQPTATMRGIAARIQNLRFRFDRSQEQFASLIGVSRESVEAWEAGLGVRREDLVRIADKTGASLHWLMSGLSPLQIEAIRVAAMQSLAAIRSPTPASQDVEAQRSAEPRSGESKRERRARWLGRSQGGR